MEWSIKQKRLIKSPFNHTIDWLEGTPRSGKTTAGIARFAAHLVASRDKNHLVVAFNYEQAYRLILDGDGYGLLHIFKGMCKIAHDDSGAHVKVFFPNGVIKKIYWKGGGKADSHKAIQGMSLGSVYFCEINLIHESMIQECLRRTYAAKDRWHIADCNPPSPNDPVIKNVLEVQDCRFIHWTCKDNPILSQERLDEIKQACSKSPFLYKRDWLGLRAIPDGVIYFMLDTEKHVLNSFPSEIAPIEMFFAGDGGTTDATSVSCYIVGARLDAIGRPKRYVLFRVGNWYYDKGDKAMSVQAKDICQIFIPYMRQKYKMKETGIYIDPACKALRLEMERFGLQTTGADNNGKDIRGTSKGIMVGIENLQSGINDGRFFLIEDEKFSTEPFIMEAGLYCIDNNGWPVDAYNHAMDETRYAYNYFYKNYMR